MNAMLIGDTIVAYERRRSLQVALITVGDTARLTGGYLYQARVIAGLRERGVVIDEIVASGVALGEQLGAADAFAARFEPEAYDVIVVDVLARVACGPSMDRWRTVRPVVVLVHQLPSIAEGEPRTADHGPPAFGSVLRHEGSEPASAETQIEVACEAALLRADVLIAVSAHGKQLLMARGVPSERIVIISPGFDRLGGVIKKVPAHPQAEDRTVLCVAQWIPRKGLTTLVGAWQRANPFEATLVLIGETDADPRYSEQMRVAISRNRHGIDVRGMVSDEALRQAYQSATLFVLPSRFEGYGMVYAEALSFGLPIIATDVGPIPELVTTAAGRFVAPDDEGALARMLAQCLDDDNLLQQLRTGARERAAMLPTWNDTVDDFMDVLASVRRSRL